MSEKPAVLISSAIFPNVGTLYGADPKLIEPELRLEQTKATVNSLVQLGYETIYIADNSGPNWRAGTEECLAPATVLRFDHLQFSNKGISELYLLQAALPQLPPNTRIIKVSGRYVLKRRLHQELGSADFLFKLYKRFRNRSYVSTVAYVVRDKAIYEIFVEQSLRELFAYAVRVVGFRSLFRIVRNSVAPQYDHYPYHDPGTSVELAMWRVLRIHRYRVLYIDQLGIEGISGVYRRVHTE